MAKLKFLKQQQTFLSSLNFYIRNSIQGGKRRKLYFCLAIFSTLISVAAVAIAQTITAYTSIIFFKAAESSVGAIDVQMIPQTVTFTKDDGLTLDAVTQPLFLNTTRIENLVNPLYPNVTTSRYIKDCVIRLLDSKDPTCNHKTLPPYKECSKYSTTLIFQNTAKEIELGMGKSLDLPAEIPKGGIIITKKLAKRLEVKAEDTIIITFNVTDILKDVVIPYNLNHDMSERIDDQELSNSIVYSSFKIIKILPSMSEKFPEDQEELIIAEYNHLFTIISEDPPANDANYSANYNQFIDFLRDQKPQNYANRVLLNFRNRLSIYSQNNFDKIQHEVLDMTSQITSTLGVFPYSFTLPVFTELKGFSSTGLFLGIILSIIIVVLFILGTILIYNLLLVTVETKTFELGILRMIGVNKLGIAQLIFIQALIFVIPGIVFGEIITVPILYYIGEVLKNLFNISVPIFPSAKAFFLSLFIGFLIPIVSSYYPMKEALGKELNLALDLVHSKTSAVQIHVQINSKKIPWPQIVFGLLSVVFGFAIYIILPLSLLSMNISLLLTLFFCVLVGLLLGLTLLSLNFQHLLERLVTSVFFFWTAPSFRNLIQKNLVAHKLRNRQTAIMYSLSLGFVIFIIVALNQVLNNLSYTTQAEKGASIEISSVYATLSNYLDLEEAIHTNLSKAVDSYTWITRDLTDYMNSNGVSGVVVTHQGHLYTLEGNIYGISSTTFQTTESRFLVVDESEEISALDLSEQLYAAKGSQSVILGTAYRDMLGLSMNYNSTVQIVFPDGVNTRTEELRALAFVESAPGFTFSKLPSVTTQDMLISLPTYIRLSGGLIQTYENIPMSRLLIKAKGGSNSNLDKIVDEFTRIKQEQFSSIKIWDSRNTADSTAKNVSTLNLIFKAVVVMVMILALFSLITSMSTNILEQTKEIAVLRAIGLTKRKVNMLYVCEAFVLVVSSAIFGIIIGTVVGWTLSIQQVLFTQLPLTLTFPFSDLLVIFIVAVISAFIAAYFPAKRVTKYNISKIIKLG